MSLRYGWQGSEDIGRKMDESNLTHCVNLQDPLKHFEDFSKTCEISGRRGGAQHARRKHIPSKSVFKPPDRKPIQSARIFSITTIDSNP